MYRFVETIKAQNGQLRNLENHQWRVDRTFRKFYPGSKPFDLKSLIKLPGEFLQGTVKVRFLYNATDFEVQFAFYTPKTINCLKLVTCDNIDYSYKFTDRSVFARLLEKAAPCNEILIVKNGLITDTSFSNIAFFDGKNWFTPAGPLLPGTFRRKAIMQGLLKETHITPADLQRFTAFKLINAMLEWDAPVLPVEKIVQ